MEVNAASLIAPVIGLVFAPLFLGVINRTKALFAGRNGQPLLQVYFDLWRLLHKGAVYSRTATWVFCAGPMVGLSAMLVALFLTPFGGNAAFAFPGDLIVFAGLLGLARFLTVIAALDTGSSFEGMGASREVHFAALTEPVMYLGLAALARNTGAQSLSAIYAGLSPGQWGQSGAALALVALTLFLVFLVENARIPVDDPNTHLELTMIHEVMVLDHCGPDLAFIQYSAALKHWVLGALIVGVVFPVRTGNTVCDLGASLIGMVVLAVVVGTVESVMARLRLVRMPQLLVGAAALGAFATVLGFMR